RFYQGEVASPVSTSISPGPQPDCGYLLEPGRTVRVPLTASVYEFEWIVQIDYISGTQSPVTVRLDETETDLRLAATEPGAISRHQFVIVSSVTSLAMTLPTDSDPLCVTQISIGPLSPSARRPG
uniref:hypothetical protein n=1 Tax=Nocardioides sp. TaxID=35761 RepID=UPI0035645D08